MVIEILENYDMPLYDPRRPSIKAWRDAMTPGERSRYNHPESVWSTYWRSTEPKEDKDRKRASRAAKETERESSPLEEELAELHHLADDRQGRIETMRLVLAKVLAYRDDVDKRDWPDLIAEIEKIIGG